MIRTASILIALTACGGSDHLMLDASSVRDTPIDAIAIDAISIDAPHGFASAQDFAIGTGPSAVALGDLDGDGKLDIVVANPSANTVSILLATPQGFSVQPDVSTGTMPVSIVLADFNADGKLDLAVSDRAAAPSITVWLNTTTSSGAVSFGTSVDFPVVNEVNGSLSVGDLNGDGRPDLAITYFCSSTNQCLSVLLDATPANGTTPMFATRADFVTTERGDMVAIGDLDGDGVPDLVVPYRSEHIGVFVNTSATNATTPTLTSVDVAVNTSSGAGATITDLDGDGMRDIAFISSGVAVLRNTTTALGLPTFATPLEIPFASQNGLITLASADLDGDGRVDLVIVDYRANIVSVLANTTTAVGAPSFGPRRDFAVGASPLAIAIGDLNGDGRPDLVTANHDANSVSVLLSN